MNKLALGLAVAALWSTANAADVDDFGHWIADGKPVVDLRLRYESVDDDAFAADAEALTLRTRLGFKTASWNGVSAYVEAEDVRALTERYNSTANGRTRYPIIADPEGSEWNQVYLAWDSGTGTQAALGRQRVQLDNQRFFGNSGWRQNEQTFDALSLSRKCAGGLVLRYIYLDRVHRVFGHDNPNRLLAEQDLDAHLINAALPTAFGTLTGYAYLIDNQDLPATSTRNLGLRFAGKHGVAEGIELAYTAEFADQSDWRDGDRKIDARYALLEGGMIVRSHALRLGYEVLGGDGRYAFQTPFATLHAFNGWADRFLTTPVRGLRDTYLAASGPLGKLTYAAQAHRYAADEGGADYGSEIDLQLGYNLSPRWSFAAKYANYDAEAFSSDESKLWLQAEFRL